ncbi:MAG: AAA family ATPase [Slackia sp.]|nr:AAA family ATPase [Slackia sp.]
MDATTRVRSMKPKMPNPFTPTFGIIPPCMAGREDLIEELSEAFANGLGDPNLSTIISGARGTGKTTLLSFMATEAESQGWITARTTASDGMLEDIIDQALVAARDFLDSLDGKKLTGVSIGQLISFAWDNESPRAGNWRMQMNALLDRLAEHDVGLLITVDEVRASIPEMKKLAQVYQHFVSEGRKVALLMAGLPHAVSALLSDEDVSFLRRSRKHVLGRIPDGEIRDALLFTIEQESRTIDAAALDEAVSVIDGFPYMMQLVGYRMWAENPRVERIALGDARHGIELAKREMAEGILEYTYRELSDGDKRFLTAMLPDKKDSAIADIARRMGVKSNYASQYKRRLLAQGIIGEYNKGYVRFDMPVFRDYLEWRMAEDEG